MKQYINNLSVLWSLGLEVFIQIKNSGKYRFERNVIVSLDLQSLNSLCYDKKQDLIANISPMFFSYLLGITSTINPNSFNFEIIF